MTNKGGRRTDPHGLERERLRQQFRPALVRVLFIGESAPASGRFFYQRDSGLYRAIRDAFCEADASIDDAGFLTAFRGAGCYLIDTSVDPVDDLDTRARRAACRAGEANLCAQIRELQPQAIVTLLRSIRENVRRAADQAGWQGLIVEVPYPGRWARHREAFWRELVPRLVEMVGPAMSAPSTDAAGQRAALPNRVR